MSVDSIKSDSVISASNKSEQKSFLGMSRIAWWAFAGIFVINILGGAFHFVFELSNFWKPAAFFASVNESTWEHLKFYFWSGLFWAILWYAYDRKNTNNFWFGQSMGLLVTPIVICLGFYSYLGVVLPRVGKGNLPADITTGVIGVIVGQIVISKILQMPPIKPRITRAGVVVLFILIGMFSTFTYFPPKMFLFENFSGYTYRGEYGILEDYTDYLIFDRSGEE